MTDATALASDLRLAVHRLTRTLRAQRPVDGLSLSQLSTLVTIYRDGPMSAGDVATREGVKPPSATRMIAGLERFGLITRHADPADGRQVLLAATAAGGERVNRDARARDAWLARRLAELPEPDLAAVVRALPVLRALADPAVR